MNNELISVIIPVYNVEKYLRRCIDSVLAQTYANLEIILVDDGSQDNSGAICDEYKEMDDRIVVIHKENGGLSSARNIGLDVAQGEYIGFIDSDDYIEKDMFEYLHNLLTKSDADISTCGIVDCYANSTNYYKKTKGQIVVNRIDAIRHMMEAKIVSVHAVNKLYRKDLFLELRYRENKTTEDGFIIVDLLERTEKVAIGFEPKYYYIHREGSITSRKISGHLFDVIEAYEYNYYKMVSISKELIEVAIMRLCWAHFYVLDRLLLSETNKYKMEIKRSKSFLKQHKNNILGSNCFTNGRKVAFIVLLMNERIYKRIIKSFYEKNRKLQ